MASRVELTAIDLILENDEKERARLEQILHVSREGMVDFFIEQFSQTANPKWRELVFASAEERLAAVQAYFRRVDPDDLSS